MSWIRLKEVDPRLKLRWRVILALTIGLTLILNGVRDGVGGHTATGMALLWTIVAMYAGELIVVGTYLWRRR